jgi:hypothetical protein
VTAVRPGRSEKPKGPTVNRLGGSIPEENTLGSVIVPKRRLTRRPLPSLRMPRFSTARIASENLGSLGTGFLGAGATVISIVLSLLGLAHFAAEWTTYPDPVPAAAAWLLYAGLLVAVGFVMRANGDRLPNSMFAAFLVGLALVVALDLIAIWPLDDIAHHATSSIAAGFALLSIVSARAARQMVAAAAGLGVILLAAMLINAPLQPESVAPIVAALTEAVLPPLAGAVLIRGFRGLVQLELDRVLIQSTVSAPRFAVGMLASEELARLDLAAEQLLEGVSTGRTPLPLDSSTSQSAASLATELRLHLIEGRRETWLYHAITESEFLGRSVTLSDPGSLAGLLDPRQRDGLLSATWLLVSDSNPKPDKSGVTVHLKLGPVAETEHTALRKLTIPVVITTTGVPRNRVDPATWDAMRKVGKHTEAMRGGSVIVEVECVVDNPADS